MKITAGQLRALLIAETKISDNHNLMVRTFIAYIKQCQKRSLPPHYHEMRDVAMALSEIDDPITLVTLALKKKRLPTYVIDAIVNAAWEMRLEFPIETTLAMIERIISPVPLSKWILLSSDPVKAFNSLDNKTAIALRIAGLVTRHPIYIWETELLLLVIEHLIKIYDATLRDPFYLAANFTFKDFMNVCAGNPMLKKELSELSEYFT